MYTRAASSTATCSRRRTIPDACVSMLLQFQGARKSRGKIQALLKRSFFFTKPHFFKDRCFQSSSNPIRIPAPPEQISLCQFELT